MTLRDQQELNEIWDSINAGKYGDDPLVIAPRRIPGSYEVVSVPNAGGTGVQIYERKNGLWSEVPVAEKPLPYVSDSWRRVKAALENPRYKWRTVEGIVKETGVDATAVVT